MRKLARLNTALIGNWRLVCAMFVVRGVLAACLLSVCACASLKNVTYEAGNFEDSIENEDYFNYTIPALEERRLTVDVNDTNPNQDDQQIEGTDRIALPIAFSYSSTTEPRVNSAGVNVRRTIVHHQPANLVVPTPSVPRPKPRSRPYRISASPYTIVPVLYHSRRPTATTSVEVEKQNIRKQETDEEPTHQVEEDEEDDGGGREETDEEEIEEYTNEDEEDGSNSQEGEDEEEIYYGPEDNEERGESSDVVEKKQDPRRKPIEFLEEYGVSEEEEKPEQEEDQSNQKEHFIESRNRPLKRPKKHQKVEDGLDKVLQAPVKFAYNKDSSPAASGHKKHGEAKKFEKGGGQEDHSDHHSSHGKKSDKGYKGYHKYDKGKKGHHDKESHEKKFSDHKGKKAKHKDAGGHFGAHHHEEKGKKGSKFGEKGEHKKGHSTKGEHDIHKKDEYVKKHEFYDEHHEGGEHEKHGGYHEKHGKKHGGKHKKGHKKSGYHDDHHGKKGHHEKGGHHDDHKGHKEASGHEEHHAHKEKYGKKEGHKEGKKWGFDKKEK